MTQKEQSLEITLLKKLALKWMAELSNLFQDNLEALNEGTISIEQMMSNKTALLNESGKRLAFLLNTIFHY